MLATSELQAWLYNTLTGGSIGATVLDHVPDNDTFPYVTIGEAVATPFRTHSRDGESLLHRVHVWSRATGFKEGLAIAEAITGLLEAATVSTASFHGFCVREQAQWFRDPDGKTRHGVLEFRIYAHATA